MSVRGIFASHASFVGDRQTDFEARLLMLHYAGMTPLTALSAGIPKDTLRNTSYSWREHDHESGNTVCPAGAAANATVFAVADSNIWIVGSIIMNQLTGEQMYITGISGNTVTVTRGFANTVPAVITAVAPLQLISTAFAEGSPGAQSVMTTGESRTAWVQIFKRAFGVTGTTEASNYRSGSKLAESRSEATMQMAEDMERAALFSRPFVTQVMTTEGVQELRTTLGLEYAIRNYGGHVVIPAANSVAGRLNLDVLTDFVRRVFEKQIKNQPNERITFTGSFILSLIHQMVMDLKGYQYQVGENAWGMEITKLVTPHGTLKLATHPLFQENTAWSKELWVMHPGGMRRKELRPLRVVTQTIDNQPNALDATSGHLLLETGYEFKGMATMGILSGSQTAGGLAALPTS